MQSSTHKRHLATILVVFAALSGQLAVHGDARAAKMDYKVSKLFLENMVGEVSVEPYSGSKTVVHVTGVKDVKKHLSFDVRQGVLHIRGKSKSMVYSSRTDGGSTSTVVIGSSSNVVIGPGASSTVIIGGHVDNKTGSEEAWKMKIQVPKGQPLKLGGVIAGARIGDIDAPLELDLQAGEVSAGSITSGRIRIDGAGSVNIGRVNGDFRVEMLGSGDVTVKQAKIGDLFVKIDGAGDVEIGGRAKRARLTIIGAGLIQVDRVDEKPDITIDGAGEINVGRDR